MHDTTPPSYIARHISLHDTTFHIHGTTYLTARHYIARRTARHSSCHWHCRDILHALHDIVPNYVVPCIVLYRVVQRPTVSCHVYRVMHLSVSCHTGKYHIVSCISCDALHYYVVSCICYGFTVSCNVCRVHTSTVSCKLCRIYLSYVTMSCHACRVIHVLLCMS